MKVKIPFTNYYVKIHRSPERKLNEYIHPDYKKAIEHAFTLDGVDYYHFKNIADMPFERWFQMEGFLNELQMRIDRETLSKFVELIEENINKGNLMRVSTFVEQIKYRLDMMMETDTVYKFATAVFFTIDEPLEDYDYDINEKKLETFKNQKIEDFFLSEPVRTLMPLQDISKDVIEAYLKETEILRRYESELMKLNESREPSNSES